MKHLRRFPVLFASLVFAGYLAGCGGGGGDAAPAGPTAEGVYGGTLTGSTSNAFQLVVLETGEFWAMYGTRTSTSFGVAGFIQGTGVSNNGSFSSSNTKDFGYAPALSGSTSASYNSSAKTISGTVSAGGSSIGFSGGPINGSLYNYDTPATISTVAGSWSTSSSTGETISLTVANSGTFAANSSRGCSFGGSIVPRSSGKNVFNVTLTFGAAPCGLPGQSVSGVAFAYPLASGQTQLLVAVVDSSRTVGEFVVGVR
jgi:hypothetical protein